MDASLVVNVDEMVTLVIDALKEKVRVYSTQAKRAVSRKNADAVKEALDRIHKVEEIMQDPAALKQIAEGRCVWNREAVKRAKERAARIQKTKLAEKKARVLAERIEQRMRTEEIARMVSKGAAKEFARLTPAAVVTSRRRHTPPTYRELIGQQQSASA